MTMGTIQIAKILHHGSMDDAYLVPEAQPEDGGREASRYWKEDGPAKSVVFRQDLVGGIWQEPSVFWEKSLVIMHEEDGQLKFYSIDGPQMPKAFTPIFKIYDQLSEGEQVLLKEAYFVSHVQYPSEWTAYVEALQSLSGVRFEDNVADFFKQFEAIREIEAQISAGAYSDLQAEKLAEELAVQQPGAGLEDPQADSLLWVNEAEKTEADWL